jgi:hypothetical protein
MLSVISQNDRVDVNFPDQRKMMNPKGKPAQGFRGLIGRLKAPVRAQHAGASKISKHVFGQRVIHRGNPETPILNHLHQDASLPRKDNSSARDAEAHDISML